MIYETAKAQAYLRKSLCLKNMLKNVIGRLLTDILTTAIPVQTITDLTFRKCLRILNRAKTVRRIFEMARMGMGSKTISKTLTAEGILTPLQHRNMLQGKQITEKRQWSPDSVISILRNRIYLGDMVQGIYEC